MTTEVPQVFIIEDDENIAAIFKAAIDQAGLTSEIISDGQTALEHLVNETPNAILLDLHLPFVSGQEILTYIRATERLAKTRVVVVSADVFKVEQLQKEGYETLLKPVGFRQMYALAVQLKNSFLEPPEYYR